MDNLIDVLLETAFKEVNKSIDKHDKDIDELKTLTNLMDKKIDELIERQQRIIDSMNGKIANENSIYNNYKNGEDEE